LDGVANCYLCDRPASFPAGATTHPASVAVDCGECGAYEITREALDRLLKRPVAKPGVRFEVFRLRSPKSPRPLVDLLIVEHFSMGFTPLP